MTRKKNPKRKSRKTSRKPEPESGDRTWNVLFCGVGGQGVLKAAEVCGVAALKEGFHVRKSEVHGMSQRGGSVESHVRFGRHVHSPLIPKGQADFLIAFDETEGHRYVSFLKKDGKNFTEHIDPVKKQLKDLRVANTFFLGMLSRFLPLSREAWMEAVETGFSRSVAENKQAFVKGAEYDLE